MTHLSEIAVTSLDTSSAFAKVAEFANIEQWDPGVVRSVKRTPGPTDVGTSYELELEYAGRKLDMTYTVTEYLPNERIVLRSRGGRVEAVDTITFAPNGGGTVVTYEADLQLRGAGRLVQPFMSRRFEAIGRAAGDGLREWLAELES